VVMGGHVVILVGCHVGALRELALFRRLNVSALLALGALLVQSVFRLGLDSSNVFHRHPVPTRSTVAMRTHPAKDLRTQKK